MIRETATASMTKTLDSDALLDRSKVIPMGEIGEYGNPQWIARELYAIHHRWNMRRAMIDAYQHGIPLGEAENGEQDEAGSSYEGDLADVNRKAIEDALIRNGHNRTRAARDLGITRRGLLRRIEKYKIQSPSAWGPGRT